MSPAWTRRSAQPRTSAGGSKADLGRYQTDPGHGDLAPPDLISRAMGELTIVRGTMIVATVAWAVGEVLMRRSPASDRLARGFWSAGVALALLHVVLAFELVYAWDHEAAVAATAQQAGDRFGWGWRGGIYINYTFLALWLADVCWWWAHPASHASRSLRLETARLAVFTFMFFNGAVVFATAAGRLVGIAAVTAVLLGSPSLRRSPVPA